MCSIIYVSRARESGIGDCDDDGIADLKIKFDRQALIAYLKIKGITNTEVTLAITGEADGTSFEVIDTIRVKGQ